MSEDLQKLLMYLLDTKEELSEKIRRVPELAKQLEQDQHFAKRLFGKQEAVQKADNESKRIVLLQNDPDVLPFLRKLNKKLTTPLGVSQNLLNIIATVPDTKGSHGVRQVRESLEVQLERYLKNEALQESIAQQEATQAATKETKGRPRSKSV